MASETQTTSDLFQGRYLELIPEYGLFQRVLQEDPPVFLRPNFNEVSCQELLSYLGHYYPEAEAFRPYEALPIVQVKGERKFWGGLKEHHTGLYFIQALSSVVAVEALAVCPDDVVLDLCAAPGGKTTHLSSQLPGGLLYANEPHLDRARVLKANLDRLNCVNVVVTKKRGEQWTRPDHLSQGLDKILLDGPCSSEGTLRVPSLKHRYVQYHPDFRAKLQQTQRELLANAAELLKPGGHLLYSTCTYDPQENEEAVAWLLEDHPELSLVPLPDHLIQLPLVDGTHQDPGLKMNLSKRIYPHYLNSIGFYVAKLVKR